MNKQLWVKNTLSYYFMAIVMVLLTSQLNADVSEDVIQRYIKIFSGRSYSIQIFACKELKWAGVSDTRVFDLIEKRLLETYTSDSREQVDHKAWLAKALSYSGRDKYIVTVEKVASEATHNRVRKHAKKSLRNFAKYKKWNPIISDTSTHDSSVSVQINQYANMIRSEDRELQILGTKRVNHVQLYNNDFILDVLANEVKKDYRLEQTDRLFVSAVARMTRMLAASSSKQKYRPVVEAVANEAPSKKLRRYAANYLKKYY